MTRTEVPETSRSIVDSSGAVCPELIVVSTPGCHVIEAPSRIGLSLVMCIAIDASPSAHGGGTSGRNIGEGLVHLRCGEAGQANPV